MSNQEPEKLTRYVIEEVAVITIDPHTKEKVCVRMLGKGTLLIEPVMRKTEKSPKTPQFDGNQAMITFAIETKKVDSI